MGHPNNLGLPALLWGMVARSPSFWRLHAMAPTLQAVWDAAPTSFFMTFKFHGIIRRWKGSCHARLYQNIVPVWYMKWHWTDMIERVSCSLHHLVLWKSFEQGNKGDSSMQRWSRRIDVEQSAESKIESPDIVFTFTSHDLDWKGTWLFGSLLWKDAHPKAAVRMGSKVKIYHKLTIRHHLRLGFVWQTSQSQICHHADPRGSWRGSWGRQRRSMGQAPLLHHVHLVCVCSEVI